MATVAMATLLKFSGLKVCSEIFNVFCNLNIAASFMRFAKNANG